GYPPCGMSLSTALSFSTQWTYTKASLVALFGLKRAFGVTPKGVGGAVPVLAMPVELLLCAASATAAVTGLVQLAVGGLEFARAVNVFWAAYQAAVLSTLFVYFNRPVSIEEPPVLFETARLAGAPAFR